MKLLKINKICGIFYKITNFGGLQMIEKVLIFGKDT